jgi:SAM-dependent methyltransferase
MITLPAEAFPFLRQQRTRYAQHPSEEAQAGFLAEVAEYAEELRPYLPAKKPQMRFIDIGCGIGFGLLGLLSIYGPEHSFVGVDRGTPDARVSYGFSETPSAYNSLKLTKDILVSAGVSAERIECVDIDAEPFPAGPADIVTSTYAWGFHFPVQVYLEEVAALLAPGGVVILDVRRGAGQEEAINGRFDVVHSSPNRSGKSDRMVLAAK